MMDNVHLVAEDEDDLYSGYNDYNPTFDSEVCVRMTHVLSAEIILKIHLITIVYVIS